MKLCQGQIWKKGGEYIRIVRLERLEVEYKSMASLAGKDGTKHTTSKKDFCRLLKQASDCWLLRRLRTSLPFQIPICARPLQPNSSCLATRGRIA